MNDPLVSAPARARVIALTSPFVPRRPLQVIEGESVANGSFNTFGYSINGGMDVDGNGYPDILVGSLDNRVALLR